MKIVNITDKVGSIGAIVAAMGCASCFPLLGALGASIGFGFLAQFEGLFINELLPIFAVIVIVSNLIAWWSHRKLIRLLLSLLGPGMVLATLYLYWTANWSTTMFYAGLLLMLVVSIGNIVFPPQAHCAIPKDKKNGIEVDKV